VITLREYGPQDFDRLMEIDQICFVEGIAYSESEMQYFLNRPSAVRIVGEQEDQAHILGFIIADCFRSRRSHESMARIIIATAGRRIRGEGWK